MTIRKFNESDIKIVSELVMKTFKKYNGKDYYEESGITKVLDSWNYRVNENFLNDMMRTDIYFLAICKNKLVGLIRGVKTNINSLFVDGDYQKQGIGSLLIKEYEKEAILQGSSEIKLESSVFAKNFYERMGYEKISGPNNYEGLKVYSMKKKLN